VSADPALKLAVGKDDSPRAGRARGGLARSDDGGEREGAALVAQPLRLFKDIGVGHYVSHLNSRRVNSRLRAYRHNVHLRGRQTLPRMNLRRQVSWPLGP